VSGSFATGGMAEREDSPRPTEVRAVVAR
jgi:hypothetical protein